VKEEEAGTYPFLKYRRNKAKPALEFTQQIANFGAGAFQILIYLTSPRRPRVKAKSVGEKGKCQCPL